MLGRDELFSRVGRGGMANVWAARHRGAHGFLRIVALKTMLPELSDDADFQRMFLAEATLAVRIRHPNVLETLDLGEEKGVLYIAMEWIVLQLKRAQMVRLLTVAWILVLTIVAVTGCGGGASGRDSSNTMTVTQGLVDCKSYDGYTAAIAEATIDCIGTIGPDSFVVNALGLLVRGFSACTPPGDVDSLLRIDRLLSLQLRPDLVLANLCIAQAWTNWLTTVVVPQNISVCPVWTKVSATGSPTPENVAQNIQTLPPLPDSNPNTVVPYGKEQFLYAVTFPAPPPLLQQCKTAQSCASACTGGFAGFFVGQSGDDIIGDPYWWLDPTDYGPDSPYRTEGYYHPMSYAPDDVPGAIYGDWARREDACSWWNGVQHVLGTLLEDKLVPSDPSTWMSRCD